MENNHYFFMRLYEKKNHELFSEYWYQANNGKINIEKIKGKEIKKEQSWVKRIAGPSSWTWCPRLGIFKKTSKKKLDNTLRHVPATTTNH